MASKSKSVTNANRPPSIKKVKMKSLWDFAVGYHVVQRYGNCLASKNEASRTSAIVVSVIAPSRSGIFESVWSLTRLADALANFLALADLPNFLSKRICISAQ